jgi:NAD+ synthase
MQTDKVIDHIVEWLVQYCDAAELKGFVVGVSGGIDSAITSTLCARTGKSVYALNMPIHQAADQISRADQHIAWLEEHYNTVTGVTVDLTDLFTAVERTLPPEISDGLTMANTRSRLRMVTLYAFAGHHRLLVAGTGNKVEDFGVGFYTKYGDGGVDIAPIADLMKSEVYAIGKALGISAAILSAPPTDGLWDDNRSDENQIGASYAELEWAMQFAASEQPATPLTDRQKEVLEIYQRFNRTNRHKMEPIPVAKIPNHLR